MMVEKSESIKENVRERYTKVAQRAQAGAVASCCPPSTSASCCGPSATDYAQKIGYSLEELGDLPDAAAMASAGCGNPTALAGLKEGEVVLDLGSGGGIDVFIAAKKVGPEGKAIGVDMTDEMLDLARRNAEEIGIENVEFRKGDIENLPVEDESVDVIISNCVINLAPDKDKVFSEAYRVLKPGGRIMVGQERPKRLGRLHLGGPRRGRLRREDPERRVQGCQRDLQERLRGAGIQCRGGSP
jgi:SAM-dependent methyltransferase